MITYINPHYDLHDRLVEMQNELQTRKWGDIHKILMQTWEPKQTLSYDVTYHKDDEGEDYALVQEGNLPTDVFAEIEGETYAELIGWRIYR